MATGTLGTNATTTLTSMSWNPMSPVADVAAIGALITGQNAFKREAPGNFSKGGRLAFPGRRGFLLLSPGDYVAVDSNGWPIVVSFQSIAGTYAATSWTHT
jgi:hypothetical protein